MKKLIILFAVLLMATTVNAATNPPPPDIGGDTFPNQFCKTQFDCVWNHHQEHRFLGDCVHNLTVTNACEGQYYATYQCDGASEEAVDLFQCSPQCMDMTNQSLLVECGYVDTALPEFSSLATGVALTGAGAVFMLLRKKK